MDNLNGFDQKIATVLVMAQLMGSAYRVGDLTEAGRGEPGELMALVRELAVMAVKSAEELAEAVNNGE